MATLTERNIFFEALPLTEVPLPKDGVLVLKEDMKLTKAVETLGRRNILAAPVVDPAKGDEVPLKERYTGIVDMVGLTFYVLDVVKEQHVTLAQLPKHKQIAEAPLGVVKGKERWGNFVTLEEDGHMLDAILLMGEGVHRIPITRGNEIVNLVTQSQVVSALAQHMDNFPGLAQSSMADLGLAEPSAVHSVTIDDHLVDAIDLIKQYHLSAVPVLGVDGAVVGNVSARDLRQLIIDPMIFTLLHKPVRQFLSAVSSVEHEDMAPAVTCRRVDTLDFVMKQLAVTKIHRVYMCSDRNHLIRVISLTDILKIFVEAPSPDYIENLMKK